MNKLSIVTYNVNGIGGISSLKRRKIFNYLHTLKAHIFMLQETHSAKETERFWKAEWGGEILFNHGTSNARGVAILFDRRFTPEILSVYRDQIGRTLAIVLKLNDTNFVLSNIYGPNVDDVGFYVDTFTHIDDLLGDFHLHCGDFNTVLDSELDIKGGRDCFNKKTSAFLKEFFTENNLIDAWRIYNHDKFQATFSRTNPYPLHERLDYIIVSSSIQQNIDFVEILSTCLSDHQPVQLQFFLGIGN